jgi:TonB-dependent receptor
LTLKEAPSGFRINGSAMTGYSGHSNSISNYKLNIHMSNRFFSDKLGIMLTGNVDLADRNSDRFRVSYDVQGTPNYDAGETYIKPWITNASMEANLEDRSRTGGSVLMDWKISPISKIKSSNFIGYLNREIYDRTKQYDVTSNYINLTQYQNEINQIVLSNAIDGEHVLYGSVIDWGASRAQSVNDKPIGHRFVFRSLSAFNGYSKGQSFDIEPPELLPRPENVNDQIERYFFQNGRFQTYESEEVESSVYLNIKIPFRLNNKITGYFKTGAKYRVKDRIRTNEVNTRRIDGAEGINQFLKVYPDFKLTTEGVTDKLSILNFLDESYESGDFLYDQYQYLKVNEVLDRDLMVDVYDNFMKDYYFFIAAGAQDDYETYESVTSYYVMSEINFGDLVTFIPGIRYEKTGIEYLAYIAESIPESESAEYDVDFQDTTATNSYGYLFPQLHLKIQPFQWFDIRLAYTHTMSRPDYNQLAPKKIISVASRRINMGNTRLKPALSKNYDLILSFYKPRLGLLTLGGFFKDIEGFLWTREALVVSGTRTDPDVINVPRSTLGYDVIYPLNNTERSTIKGIELDIQSNLNFLPVKGFILNMNFSAMESETRYLETLIKRQLNPDYGTVPGAPRVIFVNQDTAYVDRLLSQPSYLANIGFGYDNQDIGLSVRLSFNFQDDILTREQRRPDAADREGTLEFYRWDFQFSQRITKRLSLNGNVANIFNRPDQSIRLLTGYIRDIEYYGYMTQIGLKYSFY